MLEWPKYSVYESVQYVELRKIITNPGPGTPKAWAYPWCILNGQLEKFQYCLDYGCGSWTNFTEHVSQITQSMTIGVDSGHLRKNTKHVRYVKSDGINLEFPSNFFDRIFSISVLEHVPVKNRKEVLNEIFRVLRPGGLTVLTIDWIFNLDDKLLYQLSTSDDLNRIGSRIYGNYNFKKLINDYKNIVSPLKETDESCLPGSKLFNESNILSKEDILIKESTQVTDVDLFKYTTVGLILKKHETKVD